MPKTRRHHHSRKGKKYIKKGGRGGYIAPASYIFDEKIPAYPLNKYEFNYVPQSTTLFGGKSKGKKRVKKTRKTRMNTRKKHA